MTMYNTTVELQHIRACIELVRAECERLGRDPSGVRIIAATKTQSPERIRMAFEAGIHDMGENYVQELMKKRDLLSDSPVQWHFIGHLQTNKVREIAPFISMIHAVDSFRLASEINRQAERHGRIIDVLFQVNTSGENSKSGVRPDQLQDLCEQCLGLANISLRGCMCIPQELDENSDSPHEFRLLRELRDQCRERFSLESFTELSMGMSHDYPIALAEGATIIRLGTLLFGERPN